MVAAVQATDSATHFALLDLAASAAAKASDIICRLTCMGVEFNPLEIHISDATNAF